jgi:hypothetical protein
MASRVYVNLSGENGTWEACSFQDGWINNHDVNVQRRRRSGQNRKNKKR